MKNAIFVTGGAGFIGSNFILNYLDSCEDLIINFDNLNYAGNLKNLVDIKHFSRHIFVQGDITDRMLFQQFLELYNPRAIINFAAETPTSYSLHSPRLFVETNVIGTCNLLEATHHYWQSLDAADRLRFRFLHVSTDEVYGSLALEDPPFTEQSQYRPDNHYAASKAASDHFVRSFEKTYSLPTVITYCSNNYGPFQYPKNFIPLTVFNAIKGRNILIAGHRNSLRNWIYVKDNCEAINRILDNGKVGHSYNIGASNEMTNLEIVQSICSVLDELSPSKRGKYVDQIVFAHEKLDPIWCRRIDTSKIETELDWKPKEDFTSGIRKTVQWYLENLTWVESSLKKDYSSGYC
jgi:dTDP-glucose 4,6-dehydratase